jgi:hypothetical protein
VHTYTLRIELHDASWADYDELYVLLEAVGITNVTIADGVEYPMPPGEYRYRGNATLDQMVTMAKAAAARLTKACAVLVTEAGGSNRQA